MREWIQNHDHLLPWLGVVSLITFLAFIALAPLLAGWIPEDYFTSEHRVSTARHPLLHVMLLVLRTVVGALVVLAGIAMLFAPGQGILTILLGLGLMSFPGKRTLELRLVRLPRIHASLNWLRSKAGRAALELPPRSDGLA